MAVLNRTWELCLASVYALALTGVAGAADLGVKAPIVPPVPVFSWTDVYLGIGGGTGWGDNEYRWNQDPTVAAIGAQMGGAGPFPTPGATQGSVPISGGFFGGQLGGNWQVEWAVLGIQADAHWADIEGHGSCFDPGVLATAGVSFACNNKVSSFGTVTGRVGAAVDRALIYAKGGWAWADGQRSTNPSAPFNVMGGISPQASITSASSSQFQTGWTFGAGVEYAFAQNWSAFIEYNYIDLGTKDANSTHLLSLPNNVPASLVIPIQATATERFNVVKAGVNYRFNWLGCSQSSPAARIAASLRSTRASPIKIALILGDFRQAYGRDNSQPPFDTRLAQKDRPDPRRFPASLRSGLGRVYRAAMSPSGQTRRFVSRGTSAVLQFRTSVRGLCDRRAVSAGEIEA